MFDLSLYTWTWAGSLLCLPERCFVCGRAHTPNCHPSVDTLHRLTCLKVSERWPDREHVGRREICSVNTGSCQWILAFSIQGKPLRAVCFDLRCQVCNCGELTLHLTFWVWHLQSSLTVVRITPSNSSPDHSIECVMNQVLTLHTKSKGNVWLWNRHN